MKKDITRVHIVPLSRQAIAILKEIQPLTGSGRYVFTSEMTLPGSDHEKHMAPESMRSALRRMGYTNEEMTPHGFRGIASTQLREAAKGLFRSEIIEAQMAHVTGGKVELAYNHAEYLNERADMMQWWADYLYKLKAGAEILAFEKKA